VRVAIESRTQSLQRRRAGSLTEKHGGETIKNNLALACTHCNRHKGPNIAGFDIETGQTIHLLNPRSAIWEQHFAVDGTCQTIHYHTVVDQWGTTFAALSEPRGRSPERKANAGPSRRPQLT
jgi:hypothetical protein